MRKVFSESLLSTTQKTAAISAGMYRSIILRYTGTNNNGQVGTKDDAGTVKPYINGVEYPAFTPARRWEINQRMNHGVNRFSSTDNSTYEFVCELPLHRRDGNVVHLADNELKFQFSYTSPNTVFAALTLEIWVVDGFGVESYFPLPQDYNIRTYSSRTAIEPTVGFANVMELSVVYSASHSDIIIQKGNQPLFDMPIAAANLNVNLNGVWQTFTAVASLVPYVFDLYADRNLVQIISPDWRLGILSSAASATGQITKALIRAEKTRMSNLLTAATRAKRLEANPALAGII